AGLPPRIVVGHHLRKVMEENNMKFPVEPKRPENLPPRPIRPHLTTPAYTLDKLIERFTREIIPEMYRFHPKKMRPSINVVLFGAEEKAEESWKQFVLGANRGTRGQFRKITSLKEMQDAAAESEQHRERK